jgi:hypothetical protein
MIDSIKECTVEAVRSINNMANGMAFRDEIFVEEIMKMHRTSQQRTFAAMLACIKHWASLNADEYDMRNQWTVEISRLMIDALGKKAMIKHPISKERILQCPRLKKQQDQYML